ncbi:MAG: hypothetical protein JSS82_20130 [Bacteroidetes bacterium]|nr:hypothetical protein [Bacteroidota bacterium]
MPDEKNIIVFDADWYHSIVINGYVNGDAGSNTGFFIFFPFIWKILHVGGIGMALVNVLLFSFGFALLCAVLPFSETERLLLLSLPSIFFCFVPYSEAISFLEIAVVFWGIVHKKHYLVWLFLFLAGLTRATTIFLIPGFIIMELVANANRSWLSSLYKAARYFVMPIVAGLSVFIWYEHHCTGIWFVYFDQQARNWGHKFSVPVLPFGSLEGPRTLWINSLAVFTGLTALIIVSVKFIRWLGGKAYDNSLLVLSLCYMSFTTLYAIFFNPQWADGHTVIAALHRYVFATPFFFVFLHHCFNNVRFTWKHYLGVTLFANAVWLLSGSYLHIQNTLFFSFNTLCILLVMTYGTKKNAWPLLLLITICFTMQINLFQQFIGGIYPE